MIDPKSTQGTHILERDPELLKPHVHDSDQLVEHVTHKGHRNSARMSNQMDEPSLVL